MFPTVLFVNFQSLTSETIGGIWRAKKVLKEQLFPKPDCFCYVIVIKKTYRWNMEGKESRKATISPEARSVTL